MSESPRASTNFKNKTYCASYTSFVELVNDLSTQPKLFVLSLRPREQLRCTFCRVDTSFLPAVLLPMAGLNRVHHCLVSITPSTSGRQVRELCYERKCKTLKSVNILLVYGTSSWDPSGFESRAMFHGVHPGRRKPMT